MENIRKLFEEIYREQLEIHQKGGLVSNLCLLLKKKCIDSKLHFELDIGYWFKPERYDVKLLYQYRDVDRGIPIEDIDPIERWHYFWFPVSRKYNLKRLEILEKEIDNQLREEGLGD